MKSITTFLTICVTVISMVLPNHALAVESAMTNVELAGLVIAATGLTLPAGTENLPAAEYYEVLTNMLATIGLTNFVGTNPGDTINCAQFVDLIYTLAGGTGALDTEGKINYLVNNGFMSYCSSNSVITLAFAVEVFNNPGFAAIVAEAYSPAGGGDIRTAAGAPGVESEGTASKI